MRIAFLGLGPMGQVMARLLAEDGHELTVWNRTKAAAETLITSGVSIAATANDAVSQGDVVLSMLRDDEALQEVFFQQGCIDAMAKGSIHMTHSTMTPAMAEKLASEHEKRGQQYVAAPVFGGPRVAAERKLWAITAGDKNVVEQVAPLISTYTRGATWMGPEQQKAYAVKVAGNFLMTALVTAMSEAVATTEAAGISPGIFLETINTAIFQSPIFERYGTVMLQAPPKPAATVLQAIQVMEIFQGTGAENNIRTPVVDVVLNILAQLEKNGASGEDFPAAYLRQARRQTEA